MSQEFPTVSLDITSIFVTEQHVKNPSCAPFLTQLANPIFVTSPTARATQAQERSKAREETSEKESERLRARAHWNLPNQHRKDGIATCQLPTPVLSGSEILSLKDCRERKTKVSFLRTRGSGFVSKLLPTGSCIS